jgi:transposase
MGCLRTGRSATQEISQGRPASGGQPRSADRYLVRANDGHSLGGSAVGDGLWLRHDLLAAAGSVAAGRRVGQVAPHLTGQVATGRSDRLVSGDRRQCGLEGRDGWQKTGPNPTDRRKCGSKHHIITDAQGIPLAITLTGANAHDVTQLLPLVDGIRPVQGRRGRPRRRPERVQGDRGYDSQPHRDKLRQRGIQPVLAKRNTEHGSGLGVFRWVVERTLAWLHQFRRLRTRYDRRDDIHEAFMSLGCAMICWNYLK